MMLRKLWKRSSVGCLRARAHIHSLSNDNMTQLMQIVSDKKDIDEYMQVYGRPGLKRTAVIKIGGEVLQNELDILVKSLIFLRNAGLFPILVHGAGPQMNVELEKKGVEPEYVGGMRVTNAETLAVAKQVFLHANTKLVEALVLAGAPARPITSGVFEAELKDKSTLGFVGEVSKIVSSSVYSAIELGQIPVLSCLGESSDGQLLNINADVAARELAISLQPYKTIFINAKGGWIEEDGTKLTAIDMQKDYQKMADRDYTGRQGTLLKLNEIKLLLEALPRSSSVVLTSASALSREILSNCSSGTVCTRGDIKQTPTTYKVNENNGKYKVGLLGARGYVGREVIRLLGRHPKLDLVCASSRALNGCKVMDVASSPPINPHTNIPCSSVDNSQSLSIDPDLEFITLGLSDIPSSSLAKEVDIWILAMPNGYCSEYAKVLQVLRPDNPPVIIDLSADQRFNNDWVYGLPETPGKREELKGTKLISNPGCYATGAQIGLLPLLSQSASNLGFNLDLRFSPQVFGVSGYSGAGTGLSDNNNPNVLKDNIIAYKSVDHIHEREISHQLQTEVGFMPHVAPFFQGIHLTITGKLQNKNTSVEDISNFYESFYEKEPLVNCLQGIPKVRNNAKQHHVTVGGIQIDNKTGRIVVVSTIDNLLKGAATQAVQNVNLSLYEDEFLGIDIES